MRRLSDQIGNSIYSAKGAVAHQRGVLRSTKLSIMPDSSPAGPASNYKNLLRRYAAYAPNYDRKWGRYSAATLRRALEAIPIEGYSSLLDVACGTGIFAAMLREHRPNLSITGVDISADMLEHAKQRIPSSEKTDWLLGRAEELPVQSGRFDVLTCTNAFHLVQNAAKALAEFRRVLRPAGTLVLVDWCRDFPVMKFRTAVLKIADNQRRQVRTIRELMDLIEDAGLRLRSHERFRVGLWGLMCVVAQVPESVSISSTHSDRGVHFELTRSTR